MDNTQIAQVAHEANRVYCQSIGDTSQPHWENAADWAQKSAITGVEKIRSGEIQGPGDSHRSWLAEKEAEGWTFGAIKDPATKQHPCMVAFNDLPAEQQEKDYIFFSVVKSLLKLENSRA